jgi:hypothetical protein
VTVKKLSYVMGEIVDSFYMKCYTVPEYLNRTKDYVDTLGDVVDIWEVGNEINGDWTFGSTRKCKPRASVKSTPATDVASKMVAAYDYVKSKGILEHHFAEVGHRSSPYGPTLSPPNLFPLGQSPKSTRQAVQHQCKGNAVYGAKGIAAPEGWWLYYSQRLPREC